MVAILEITQQFLFIKIAGLFPLLLLRAGQHGPMLRFFLKEHKETWYHFLTKGDRLAVPITFLRKKFAITFLPLWIAYV